MTFGHMMLQVNTKTHVVKANEVRLSPPSLQHPKAWIRMDSTCRLRGLLEISLFFSKHVVYIDFV